MLRRAWTLTLLVSLAATGCTKKGGGDAAARKAPTQRERCDAFLDRFGGTARMAASMLAVGLSETPQDAAQAKREMDAAWVQTRGEIMGRCMAWDDEVFRCVEGLGMLDPQCERIVAVAMGEAVAPQDVASGPTPTWTHEIEEEPALVRVTPQGRVLVREIGSERLVLVERGKTVAELESYVPFLVEGAPQGPWLTARGKSLLAIEPDRRLAEVFDVTLPPVGQERNADAHVNATEIVAATADGAADSDADADADAEVDADTGDSGGDEAWDDYDDDPPETASPKVAVRTDGGWLVGDSEARFWSVDPKTCAAAAGGRAGCLHHEGTLADEYLDSDARLFVLPSGIALLWEDDVLRGFDEGFVARFELRGLDDLAHVSVRADGTVALLIDSDLVVIDPQRCIAPQPFKVSAYPQPGRLYFADELQDLPGPPRGCRQWRAYVNEADSEPFADLDDGTIVLNDWDATLAVRGGEPRWKAALGASGATVGAGTVAYAVSTGDDENPAMHVWKLAADGTPSWKATLPSEIDSAVFFTDDIHVDVSDRWLVAGYEGTLAVFELPAAP